MGAGVGARERGKRRQLDLPPSPPPGLCAAVSKDATKRDSLANNLTDLQQQLVVLKALRRQEEERLAEMTKLAEAAKLGHWVHWIVYIGKEIYWCLSTTFPSRALVAAADALSQHCGGSEDTSLSPSLGRDSEEQNSA
eukprot:3529519-Pleurochrysis_carterae.AAC.2